MHCHQAFLLPINLVHSMLFLCLQSSSTFFLMIIEGHHTSVTHSVLYHQKLKIGNFQTIKALSPKRSTNNHGNKNPNHKPSLQHIYKRTHFEKILNGTPHFMHGIRLSYRRSTRSTPWFSYVSSSSISFKIHPHASHLQYTFRSLPSNKNKR